MNLLEHITSVQDRLKMVGSEKASIQLDGKMLFIQIEIIAIE